MTAPGGSAPGGLCLLWGVSAPGGRCVWYPTCTEADTPPPVDRITDACKNITLATTSLRPVKTAKSTQLLPASWYHFGVSICCTFSMKMNQIYSNNSLIQVD